MLCAPCTGIMLYQDVTGFCAMKCLQCSAESCLHLIILCIQSLNQSEEVFKELLGSLEALQGSTMQADLSGLQEGCCVV